MREKYQNFAEGLLQFLNGSPTAFHAVENAAALLKENGFEELKETESWSLKNEGRYFVVKNSSAVIAFVVGRFPHHRRAHGFPGAKNQTGRLHRYAGRLCEGECGNIRRGDFADMV